MKKILIIIIFVLFNKTANCQITDTLQFLKSKIDSNKSHYVGKKLQVLFDTLYKYKLPIKEYGGTWDYRGANLDDTLWVKDICIYFDFYLFTNKFNAVLHTKPDINGHRNINVGIKEIQITFSNPIPYLRVWDYLVDENEATLGKIDGVIWNRRKANFYRNCIIQDLKVSEF